MTGGVHGGCMAGGMCGLGLHGTGVCMRDRRDRHCSRCLLLLEIIVTYVL